MVSAEVVNGGGGGGDHLKKKNSEEYMVQQLVQPIKKQKVVQQEVPYLGEDIITQILLKIPAQSLFKTLRYVCKSWLNMISTHPDIHLNRLLPSKPPCLILQNVDDRENNLITCFFTLSREGMIEKQCDDLYPIFKNGLWIIACCNGLILATTYYSNPTSLLYVVNPLTNHKLIISDPGGPLINPKATDLVFIPSTGEYKVIIEQPGSMQGGKCIHILTLSASDCYGSSSSCGCCCSSNDRLQWRLIEAPKQIIYGSLVAINGIFYWRTSSIGNIVSFDACVEKFYETTCHHNDKKASRKGHWGLLEMGGLLSSWSILLGEYDDVWRFNVRVVKDFLGGEWTDKYSIPIDTDFMKNITDDYLSVLGFGNIGEVMIFHNLKEKTMWALNVKLNQWWKVGNRNLKENLRIWFKGLHVNNKTVPLESIFAIE